MDPFAGGSSQLKDTTAAEGDESHRTADGPAAPLPTSKFETRGTPTAAGGQQYTSATLLYQMQALRSKSKQSEPQSQPSPPSATPNSSGEQMPPPPIASQRFATAVAPAKSQNPAPRRSTSSGSASSKTAHSDSDKDKADKKLRATGRQKSRDKSARASSSLKEFLGSRVSALQQQDKQQQPFPSLPSPHKKNSTREKTAAEEAEEDEEETQLVLTEDRPPSSPAVGSYDGAGGEDELIMSGDAAASREREEDSEESSRSSDSSEAEDDDAEDERRIAGVSHLKREREFEEYGDEEEAECKRRNLGQRSQVGYPSLRALDSDLTDLTRPPTDSRADLRGVPRSHLLARRPELELRASLPLRLDPAAGAATSVLLRFHLSSSSAPSACFRPSHSRPRPLPRRESLPATSAGSLGC